MANAPRILLVEDDRFLRRACAAGLAQRGFSVSTAADGREGLRLARDERPDVVLLDLLMPGMSGLDVLTALRADPTTREMRILVLSNSSHERHVTQVTGLGAEYVVKSNISLRELAERIERLLERPAPVTAACGKAAELET